VIQAPPERNPIHAPQFCSDWRRIGDDTPSSALSVQTLDPPEHTAMRTRSCRTPCTGFLCHW
jgi:hypothetical protein